MLPRSQLASGLHTTMLSSKGRLCSRKDEVLGKLQALRDRLQGLSGSSDAHTDARQQAADAAKQAWLDAEGQHAILQRTGDTDALEVKAALKKAVGLQDVVDDDKRLLKALQDNFTSELAEIDEEESTIREELALVSQVSGSAATVRRARLSPRARRLIPRAKDQTKHL